ncbi:unnamed protein product, partial [marine sediment metagenome]
MKDEQQCIFSPFSIFYLMELVYMATSKETRQELRPIFSSNQEQESEIIKDMI